MSIYNQKWDWFEYEEGGESSGSVVCVDVLEEKLINESYDYENANVTQIIQKGFYYDGCIKSVSFPNVEQVGTEAFYFCTNLNKINMPKLKNTFQQCFGQTALENACFPNLTRIGNLTFNTCVNLKRFDIGSPVADSYGTSIGANALNKCYSLTDVIIRTNFVVAMANVNALNNCYHFNGTTDATYNPTGAKDGYIYVPRNLVDSYKAATNWTTFASQFRALEDYTVDGTITGALDESKI